MVHVVEEVRGLVDGGFQLDDLELVDGVLRGRTSGDTRAVADERDLGGVGGVVEQERQKTDADLGRHVGVVRGVDLAVVLHREDLAPLIDRDRGGDAVLVIDQLGSLPFLLLVTALDHIDVVAGHGDAEEADGEAGQVPARQRQGEQRHGGGGGHAE